MPIVGFYVKPVEMSGCSDHNGIVLTTFANVISRPQIESISSVSVSSILLPSKKAREENYRSVSQSEQSQKSAATDRQYRSCLHLITLEAPVLSELEELTFPAALWSCTISF